MKTKEYVKKYRLDLQDKFNHSEFVKDLTRDLIALLEFNKAENNIKGFDNALRCIRMKFDAIRNKTRGDIPEKLWKYFFATVVAPLREELCPKDMEFRRREKERRQKENAWRQEKERRWEEEFKDDFYSRFYSFFFKEKTTKPIKAFEILQLTIDAGIEEVKKAYWKLAQIHHPDKGGKQDAFLEIADAKNQCLSWLGKN